jgi:ribosomal protein S18 acetylase RimI-like enzyme/acyl carrier protein
VESAMKAQPAVRPSAADDTNASPAGSSGAMHENPVVFEPRPGRMTRHDIRQAVLATIALVAPEADLHAIDSGRPLREQVDLDSMDWMNVVAGLSEKLSIEIPEVDYGRLGTLDSIIAYAAVRQAGRRSRRRRGAAAGSAAPGCTRHLIKGIHVTLRPMSAGDAALEVDFVRRLSMQSRYERFMLTVSELPQSKLTYLTVVDQVQHVALMATTVVDGRETMIGVARYVIESPGASCEFAIAVDDAWKGSGLAGILMRTLMQLARKRGLETMEGIVLATNSRMLKFVRQLGFTVERDPEERSIFRVARSL